jgi:hypothetical protein
MIDYQGRRCSCSTPAFRDHHPILPDIPDRKYQIRRPMIPDSTLQFRPLTALHAMHVLFNYLAHYPSLLGSRHKYLPCSAQVYTKQTHRIT